MTDKHRPSGTAGVDQLLMVVKLEIDTLPNHVIADKILILKCEMDPADRKLTSQIEVRELVDISPADHIAILDHRPLPDIGHHKLQDTVPRVPFGIGDLLMRSE